MTTATNTLALDADPMVQAYPELREFWTAAQDGRLLLRSCTACGRPHAYPRMICPFCRSRELRWETASGRGVIHSYSVMRRVAIPHVLAYVRLEEGVTLLTNIVDCGVDEVAIGQSVEVVFRSDPGGRPVPYFQLHLGGTSGTAPLT